MRSLILTLTVGNWIAGAAVIVYGLAKFWASGSVPALLVALAVLIVGPLEDILEAWVRRRTRAREEPQVELVDKGTSLVFLILLFVVLQMIP